MDHTYEDFRSHPYWSIVSLKIAAGKHFLRQEKGGDDEGFVDTKKQAVHGLLFGYVADLILYWALSRFSRGSFGARRLARGCSGSDC